MFQNIILKRQSRNQKWTSFSINLVAGKNFRFRNLRFKRIPTEKNVFEIVLWVRHFFTIWVILAKKTKFHEKKITQEKNFRFRDFQLKIRFEIFWIDSDQKNFRPKFFDLVIFSLFWSFWPKKQSPTKKKFYTGKIFDFEIFGL